MVSCITYWITPDHRVADAADNANKIRVALQKGSVTFVQKNNNTFMIIFVELKQMSLIFHKT